MNEYIEQAHKFLRDSATTIQIKKADIQTAPRWSKDGQHGYKYQVTLKRNRGNYTFDFWDSIANRQEDKKPTQYDILACLSVFEGSIDDFVSTFGFDNSKVSEVLDTYNAVVDQSLQLKHLFTAKQLEQLAEIN